MEILAKENLVGETTAPTTASRTFFTRQVGRIVRISVSHPESDGNHQVGGRGRIGILMSFYT